MPPRQPVPASTQRPAPWRWGVVGAWLGAAIALLAFLPAAWLAQAVGSASGEQVLLSEARGTVWEGSARLVLTGGKGSRDRTALPGRLQWRLRPGLLALRIELAADCCMRAPLQLQITPRWRGVILQVADSQSTWPAALLAGLGTPWNTLQIEGQMALATRQLSVEWTSGRMSVLGRAELTATDVASRLSSLKPMGSYRITMTGGTMTQLDVTTLNGRLQLSGTGTWVGARLRFRGEARAGEEHEAALANLLNIIGRRQGARSIISVG